MINPKYYAALGVALGVGLGAYGLWNSGYKSGSAAVSARWNAERLVYNERLLTLTNKFRVKEQELQTEADQIRKDAANEKDKLSARVSALNASVLNRSSRTNNGPAVVPAIAGTCPVAKGYSGDKLYREDAQFLVGQSELAERTKILLTECRASYEAARKKLNEVNK